MNNYSFHQDVKCTVWVRQFFDIEAENLEEAKRKAIKFQNEDVSKHLEFTRQEYLLDTEELVLPEENDHQTTMELYVFGSTVPFACNGSDEYKRKINRWNEYMDAHCVAQKDMTGYSIEATFNSINATYKAFHNNGKLVVIVFKPEKEAVRYTFETDWDELVNQDEYFRKHMTYYLKKKYPERPDLDNEIHDWLAGHLTDMMPSSNVVDDAVPFTLADLIEAASHMAAVYEYRAAKLLGYQIVDEEGEIPDGLYSFQVIEKKEDALHILHKAEVEEPHLTGLKIYPVYEGDIEGPSFI